MLVEAALILRLMLERRRRHLAELEAHRRLSELDHLNRRAAVGELSASIAHELTQPLGARAGQRTIIGRTVIVDDSSAQLSIEDSGPGIPVETRSHLFEPFSTTMEAGMGMGLSIARAIEQSHGGRIWGENRAGGGAVFGFTLPLIQTAVNVDQQSSWLGKPVPLEFAGGPRTENRCAPE